MCRLLRPRIFGRSHVRWAQIISAVERRREAVDLWKAGRITLQCIALLNCFRFQRYLIQGLVKKIKIRSKQCRGIWLSHHKTKLCEAFRLMIEDFTLYACCRTFRVSRIRFRFMANSSGSLSISSKRFSLHLGNPSARVFSSNFQLFS